ncbi:MAG: GNAT family N-acetyltransferase [Anaerolineales bacterium]|jgi:RimJ/RimL family protein N-acetyltransferase
MNELLELREVLPADLEVFFANMQEPEAVYMAAFTAKDPADREAFEAHWERILADPQIVIRTIVVDGRVAGSVLSYVMEGAREVSYWIGRAFWGRGITTRALQAYLQIVQERPLYARAAHDNLGSLRVLEKCGFQKVRTDRYFANGRGQEIEEIILRLDASPDTAAGPGAAASDVAA